MRSFSRTTTRNKTPGRKGIVLGIAITLAACILPPALLILFCSVTKFPPQIFGNNEDHFRAHVIESIPESVENLQVSFDDIIIHPDVFYYFRFTINRAGLEKIISHRSLRPVEECTNFDSYAPEWWDFSIKVNLEAYEFRREGGNEISLCYDTSTETGYYLYLTY